MDPLYGVLPKDGVVAPLWLVYRGALFLVGERDTIACLPASNMVIPNEEQVAVMEDVLANNQYLLQTDTDDVDVLTDVTTTGDSMEIDTTTPLQE
jgi:hypothetical protein